MQKTRRDVKQKSSDIAVASLSAAQLFSEQHIIATANESVIKGQLNLPEYQRPYRWSFDDVSALLSDISVYCGDRREQKPLLYMGSVVLHQVFDSKSKSYFLNIIDGQQRITTLSLICMAIEAKKLNKNFELPAMEYASPVSHERIAKNYQWLLAQTFSEALLQLNLDHINFTLVVTQSEDEAYRFFETQNTGGVRLTGPQVIKAHHLRAIPNELQSNLARKWESFNYLDEVVIRLLKARRWQTFNFNHVPSHRAPESIKKTIVNEFANKTREASDDMAFSRCAQNKSLSGAISQQSIEGYLAKQPLNAGVNTVHYFDYFNLLYQDLLVEQSSPYLDDFYQFYNAVVIKANNSDYLVEFYDIAILLYVSEFGTEKLIEAAYWLARCVFSIRLKNKKTVREDSISAFAAATPLLDWISTAYQHQQLVEYLIAYSYDISADNIGKEDGKGVKQKFLNGLAQYFDIDISGCTPAQLASGFDSKLQCSITCKVNSIQLATNSSHTEVLL